MEEPYTQEVDEAIRSLVTSWHNAAQKPNAQCSVDFTLSKGGIFLREWAWLSSLYIHACLCVHMHVPRQGLSLAEPDACHSGWAWLTTSGFWEIRLRCSHLYGGHFTDWTISLQPWVGDSFENYCVCFPLHRLVPLDSSMSSWHKPKSSERRAPQLRKRPVGMPRIGGWNIGFCGTKNRDERAHNWCLIIK